MLRRRALSEMLLEHLTKRRILYHKRYLSVLKEWRHYVDKITIPFHRGWVKLRHLAFCVKKNCRKRNTWKNHWNPQNSHLENWMVFILVHSLFACKLQNGIILGFSEKKTIYHFSKFKWIRKNLLKQMLFLLPIHICFQARWYFLSEYWK